MADIFTQTFVHLVLAVQNREAVIFEAFRVRLQDNIINLSEKMDCQVYAIYCMPDHTHLLVSMHPEISISEFVSAIKLNSAEWINKYSNLKFKFQWQEGFGAFTCSKQELKRVIRYIKNQPRHHSRMVFREEFLGILRMNEMEHRSKHVFNFML